MNLQSLITDNITEILTKIIEFTKLRQSVLTKNINNIHNPYFLPKDMEVDKFSALMNSAIKEHLQNQRLILCDSENIKFGEEGLFEAEPIVDQAAKKILEHDTDAYLELQTSKLLENALNQRIATELLNQKNGIFPNFE